jgi:hypothetical protein
MTKLGNKGIGFEFPTGTQNFTLLHRAKIGPGATCLLGTGYLELSGLAMTPTIHLNAVPPQYILME